MAWIDARLSNKLRLSTLVLLAFVLLGSLAAYLKMRQVSSLSAELEASRLPALEAIRDLRVSEFAEASSLKSYVLFGSDLAMAQRYSEEIADYREEAQAVLQRIGQLRPAYDRLVRSETMTRLLDQYAQLEAAQKQVQTLAIGEGNDATSKAFDLLQGQVAQQTAAFTKNVTDVVNALGAATDRDLKHVVEINRMEALFLWLAILFGGLIGTILAEMALRRVVRSVGMVAERAQLIASGDLTGEPLHMDSSDEVTQLAGAINQMQENLRNIIRTMMEIAATVAEDSAKLSRSANETFRRTKEQSLQTQQAAAAMQEMSISIAEVSRHAQSAAANSRQAATTAREGGTIVDQMLNGMNSIAESVRNTAATVQRLGRESEQIIRIVNVIEEIAQKTNLLALNAAIEAARAGEQGRGFAVVAGEVRRLAESTRNATSEIAQMIQGIQAHTRDAVEAMEAGTVTVNEGVEINHRAGKALSRIIQMAEQVDSMIAQIATASMQQADAARQSSESVEAINQLGEEAAAAIPDTNAIVESVGHGAKRLEEHIGKFRLEEVSGRYVHAPAGKKFTPAPLAAYGD
ncbi:MAG TPA: methyl-accepting chemotaxis protein [Acidobacteriaceae bacterium]|nr:methyl-accepting chemotaxis protein [Acidobacteriaceae bacterium]